MRTISIMILLFVLLINQISYGESNTQVAKKSDLKKAQNILLQIDNHDLGKSLFNLIQIHAKIKTPFDDIRNLIETSLQQLKQDKEDDYNKNYADQLNCNQLKEQFENTIEIHKAELKTQNEILQTTQDSLQTNQEVFDLANNRLITNQNVQAEGKKVREEENVLYLEQKEEIEQTLAAIDETESLLKHLRQGSSFFQLRQYFNKMKKAFKERKSSHILYKPIVQLLMQLNSSADQETIDKIFDLLQKLTNSINQAYDQASAIENSATINWETQLSKLQIEETSLQERIGQLQQTINNLQNIVIKTQEGVEFHSVEIVKAQDNLVFTTSTCQQLQDDYEANSAQRNKEIEIFEQILDIFVNKIDTMEDYLKARAIPQ